jgi:hypothetical protein
VVKTIIRSDFYYFSPGISYWVQENANTKLKTATKQCHFITIVLVKIICIFYKINKIFEKIGPNNGTCTFKTYFTTFTFDLAMYIFSAVHTLLLSLLIDQ